MKENPYSALIETMQTQGKKVNTPSIKIAKIIYVEEDNEKLIDIKLEVDELIIDKDNIYISDFLTKEHEREMRTDNIDNIGDKQHLTGVTSVVNDSGDSIDHSHIITNLEIHHTKTYTRDTLKVDDLVAVMPVADKQIYIVLSRVVKL